MNLINKSLLIFCLLSLSLFAQKDVEGSKDHPLIPRFPGSTIVYFNEVKNGVYEYTLGPISPIITNQNIDGREINQRIELLLKNF